MTRADEMYKQLCRQIIINSLTSQEDKDLDTIIREEINKGREEIIDFLNTREEAKFEVTDKEILTVPRGLKLTNVPNGMTQIN